MVSLKQHEAVLCSSVRGWRNENLAVSHLPSLISTFISDKRPAHSDAMLRSRRELCLGSLSMLAAALTSPCQRIANLMSITGKTTSGDRCPRVQRIVAHKRMNCSSCANDKPATFDGRYFGPLGASSVIGLAQTGQPRCAVTKSRDAVLVGQTMFRQAPSYWQISGHTGVALVAFDAQRAVRMACTTRIDDPAERLTPPERHDQNRRSQRLRAR